MLCAARLFRATLALGLFLANTAPCLAVTNPATVPALAYASLMRSINPHLQVGESRAYASALLTNSRKMHVDPLLVMALVTVESGWNVRAESIDGAEGLGQIKPGTARVLGIDPWSPRSNIRGITMYLHRLLGLFGEARQPIREALAGYNAGPIAVKRYGGVPPIPETRRYVAKVLSALHAFRLRLPAAMHFNVRTAVAVADTAALIDRSQAAYWGAR